ncbi:hypothetical protein [Microbacterium testaceum]|uniref:hypothetical protein n=1 Tax=Microbacterium testaceum TaxID=2033 RepID=UPI000734DD3C|nr:hypothetical protein [Microbacterium testaceum]
MAEVKETAGRLIYAAADRDMSQVLDALRGFGRERNLALILTLADTAAASLETLHGDNWREARSMAMLDAELDEEVSGGSAEVG